MGNHESGFLLSIITSCGDHMGMVNGEILTYGGRCQYSDTYKIFNKISIDTLGRML